MVENYAFTMPFVTSNYLSTSLKSKLAKIAPEMIDAKLDLLPERFMSMCYDRFTHRILLHITSTI